MKSKILGLLLPLLFIYSHSAFAGEVKAIKGNRVLLDISGTDAQTGWEFYLVNSDNKKTAIVKIKQVKNSQAVAEITRGSAVVGETLLVKSAPPSQEAPPPDVVTNPGDIPSEPDPAAIGNPGVTTLRKKMTVGALVSYNMNTFAMAIGPLTTTARDSASLTGTSFSFKVYLDYDLNQRWTIRGASGLETFSAAGSIPDAYCNSGTSASCSVNFSYLPAEASIHFNYLTGKTRAWIGAGGALLLQISASNNIPNLATNSSTNQVLLISTGVDIPIGKKKYIPIELEYGDFPGSSITASSIYLRAGFALNL